MSTKRKIFNQTIIFSGFTIIGSVIGFFFKAYVSYNLGAHLLGIFTLGMVIIQSFSFFSSLGYGQGLVRFISKYLVDEDYSHLGRFLKKSVIITFRVSLISSFIIFFIPNIFGVFNKDLLSLKNYILYFCILFFIGSFNSLLNQGIRGLQEIKYSTITSNIIIIPLKAVICFYLFSNFGVSLHNYLYSEIITTIMSVVICSIIFYKIIPKNALRFSGFIKTEYLIEENNFRKNALLLGIVALVYSNVDKILLTYYFSFTELGIYGVILTISHFLPLMLNAVNSIFSPIISQLNEQKENKEIENIFQITARYIIALTIPGLIFLITFSRDILSIFGPDFTSGSILLILVVFSHFFNLATGSCGMLLIMTGNEKAHRKIITNASILSTFIYIVSIPYLGFIGIGISKIFHNIFTMISILYKIKSILNITLFNKLYIKSLILYLSVSVIMYLIFSKIVINNNLSLIFNFIIFYVVFLLTTLSIFPKDELRYFLKIVQIKND